MRWPKYWSFSFSIIPSKEIPGLISFRMDWLDLLAVQGTLKGLLQHHGSKASILQRSAFFTVQLSHPYMTTGKTIALTKRTFVGKVMSLFSNMLSRLVITFLPRSMLSCFSRVQLFATTPGSSIHGILQARILVWVAMPSSRESSRLRDQTHVHYSPALAGRFFTTSATWEALLLLSHFSHVRLCVTP